MVGTGEVFVLGAGFSKAIREQMPTLHELGGQITDLVLQSPRSAVLPETVRAQLQLGHIPGGNVEAWLSSLAERQPFLSESEAAYSQAMFLEISQHLADLVARPADGFWDTAPAWLHRLVRLWHRKRVTVITFNYDTIVESALRHLDLPGSHGNVEAAALGNRPLSAVAAWAGTEEMTLSLLKLHGSVDWFWNPTDPSGDSLRRLPLGVGEIERRAVLAGKSPFIIPPLATKGPFYSLGLVRALWREAGQALDVADRIIIVGYSVPLADLAAIAMLSQMPSASATWEVVDPDGRRVSERLELIGVDHTTIAESGSIATFVDSYEASSCARVSSEVAQGLKDARMRGSEPILVRPSRSARHLVTAVMAQDTRVLLTAETPDPREPIPAGCPRASDLARLLHQLDTPLPLFVRIGDASDLYAILGLDNPADVRGTSGVDHWLPLEMQDTPTIYE